MTRNGTMPCPPCTSTTTARLKCTLSTSMNRFAICRAQTTCLTWVDCSLLHGQCRRLLRQRQLLQLLPSQWQPHLLPRQRKLRIETQLETFCNVFPSDMVAAG